MITDVPTTEIARGLVFIDRTCRKKVATFDLDDH